MLTAQGRLAIELSFIPTILWWVLLEWRVVCLSCADLLLGRVIKPRPSPQAPFHPAESPGVTVITPVPPAETVLYMPVNLNARLSRPIDQPSDTCGGKTMENRPDEKETKIRTLSSAFLDQPHPEIHLSAS